MKRNNINTKEKIKRHFFISPNSKLRVREIERNLGLALPSVIRYCRELQKEGILMIIQMGKAAFYTADKASRNFLLEKKLYNIRSLHECGLMDFLKRELNNPAIVVFGSYSKGEDTEESDIDLYVETPSKRKIDFIKFENELKRKIQIFQHANLHEIKNIHLANNIINGIILNGAIEVLK